MTTGNRIFIAGAALGALGVALGAVASHALKARLGPYELGIFETAARYQMYHALALVAISSRSYGVRWPAILFVAGVVLFSGSLYVLALTGERWLGAVTPLGGACFIAGWIWLAVCAWLQRSTA